MSKHQWNEVQNYIIDNTGARPPTLTNQPTSQPADPLPPRTHTLHSSPLSHRAASTPTQPCRPLDPLPRSLPPVARSVMCLDAPPPFHPADAHGKITNTDGDGILAVVDPTTRKFDKAPSDPASDMDPSDIFYPKDDKYLEEMYN